MLTRQAVLQGSLAPGPEGAFLAGVAARLEPCRGRAFRLAAESRTHPAGGV